MSAKFKKGDRVQTSDPGRVYFGVVRRSFVRNREEFIDVYVEDDKSVLECIASAWVRRK